MLLQQSGSDPYPHTYRYKISDPSQVGEARRFASVMGDALGFDEVRHGRIGIIINELGNNLVKYAIDGQILLRTVQDGKRGGIEIIAIDKGPGFSDPSRVMQDGFSTGTTPGTGLGAVRRQADVFDIFSEVGKGTAILTVLHASDEWETEQKSKFYFSAVCLPIHGETVCGDAWSIREDGDKLTAIVADGLGHGEFAHLAAIKAVKSERATSELHADQILNQIHVDLKSTRGAAVFVVKIHGDSIEYCGVGNIRALLCSDDKPKTLVSNNGTAGLQIRTLRNVGHDWDRDGVLILHSDGILGRWDLSGHPGLLRKHPGLIAAVINRDFSRNTDDTTVLVIGRRQ